MTPSTSSSSTGPSQGQSNQLYTTAGTVYNPSAVIPLQPPARKGRASRWPPPSQVDFALLHKSAPPGPHYTRSPPTTASSLKYYSPLQQNSDRAVKPSAVPNQLNRSISDSSSLSHSASHQLGTVTGLDRDENNSRFRNMSLQHEDKEEDDLAHMSYVNKLGVKALTNLASYPNLHQLKARRALDKARETVKAAENVKPAETSRPMSATSSREGFQRQQEASGVLTSTTELSRDHGDTSGRSSRTDHMAGSTRSSVLSSGPGAPRPLTAGPPGSTRSSVLSSGPGAPRPLTAGPPGQRQYRAATLDSASRAPHSDIQRPSSAIDETHFDINPSVLVNRGGPIPSRTPSRPQTPDQAEQLPVTSDTDLGKPPLFNAFASVHPPDTARRPGRTRDTLPPDQVRQYFRQGFPSDYHYDPESVPPFLPDGADLGLRQGRFLPTPEQMRPKDAELLKTLDERVTDARNKLQDMEPGLSETSQRAIIRMAVIDRALLSSRLGKPDPEFTIDFVNKLPTHEAATPLLKMAFSTLSNYWDNGRLVAGIPTGLKTEDDDIECRNPTIIGSHEQPNSSRGRRRDH